MSDTPIAAFVEAFKLNSRCVYVISEGPDGPIKIGKSADPEARLRTLQTGNPRQLRMIYACRFESEMADEVETCLHLELAESRLAGEWFDFSEDLILDYIRDFWLSEGIEVRSAA